MGTTAEKFNYAFGTKDLLKTEINKINNVLTDESTFRSYPQELFNGYLDILNNGTDTLWNNLEKVSQTGTEPVLENVETAPMKMVLNGNTSQDTTSGKNILPIQDGVADLNGVTLTIENGILTLNGTTTASGSFKLTNGIDTQNGGIPNVNWLQEEAIENLNGKVLSFQNISGISPASSWAVRLFDNTTTYTRQYTYSQLSGDKLFDTDIRLGVMTIYLNANLTFDNFKVAIQIENGTNSTDFEKYTGGIPSPNPDYPQEVKVVKGQNTVSVQGKNLFDTNYYLETQYGTAGGVLTNTAYFKDGENITTNVSLASGRKFLNHKKLSAGTYTMSFNKSFSGTGHHIRYSVRDFVNLTDIVTTKSIDNTNISASFSFTLTEETDVFISIQPYSTDEGTLTLSNIQLEEGSATPYVSYSKTDYPINLGTLELCKINNYKDFPFKAINGNEYYDSLTEEQKNALNYGSWYVHKEIGKKIFDGSENWKTNRENDNYMRFHARALSNVKVQNTGYSNLFIVQNESSSKNTLSVYPGNNFNVYIWLSKSIADSVANFKTWLSTHNTIVYYVLATPTEEEITNTTLIEQLEAISKAKSVKDKTYITQTNEELPFILDVEAIKEYSVE